MHSVLYLANITLVGEKYKFMDWKHRQYIWKKYCTNNNRIQEEFLSILKAHSQVCDNFRQLKALWKWQKMLFISP